MEMTIHDNGAGISRIAQKNPSSMGIYGLKERVHLLKREVTIKGAANKGTKVRVQIHLVEKGTEER